MGKLLGIAIKEGSRRPMIEKQQSLIGLETGVEGDYKGKPGKRQVTVLTKECWADACKEVKEDLHWTKRRANLFIEGIDLMDSLGKYLKIGSVFLEITGETHPCNLMDEQKEGLRTALIPGMRGGVTCCVALEGLVKTGDTVELCRSVE